MPLANCSLRVQSNWSRTVEYEARRVLIQFSVAYLCEKMYFALVYIENEYRKRLQNKDSDLQLKLSSVEPELWKIVAEMKHRRLLVN